MSDHKPMSAKEMDPKAGPKDKKPVAAAKVKKKAEGSAQLDHAKEKMVALEQELKQAKDQALRAVAQMHNAEKIAQREARQAKEMANRELLKALVPILDSLDYGLQSYESDKSNIKALEEGLTLTHNMMAQVLKEHHIEVIDPIGLPFDPQKHEALSTLSDPKAKPNTVLQVMQKGYSLSGRVIRAAKVIVNAS